MAPTQQQSTSTCEGISLSRKNISNTASYSNSLSHSSSSSSNSSSSNCNMSRIHSESQGGQASLLPITCRGQFYHDTFFKEARQHFDAAVRDVLDHWGQRSALEDDLVSYRKLRESNLTEASQAVTTSEDEHSHQVVMDVKDFLSGDVKVKVVDENELVVEGSVEQRQDGSVSKKSFGRGFTFPGLVKPEAVTSTMSSDGILTVTVPKKQVTSTNNISIKKNDSLSSSSQNTTDHKVSKTSSQRSVLNAESSASRKDSKTSSLKSELSSQSRLQHETSERSTTKNLEEGEADSIKTDETSEMLLPILHRGLFFQDSLFSEAHKEFEAAVKKVLDTWGETSVTDDLTCYRSLRERDLKEENQAVSVTEDHQNHKVVMDVKDFLSGDVKVKVVDENELVVEGSVEQQQGESVSKKSFCRGFTFPGLVKPEAVTSTMSSDGVLTVTVPKKRVTGTCHIAINKNDSVSISSQNTADQKLSKASSQKSTFNVESSTTRKSSETSDLKSEMSVKSKLQQDDASRMSTTKKSQERELDSAKADQTSELLLPISHRGLFFQDAFFSEAHKEFEAAVKKVLNTWGETSVTDDLTSYRSLRERDLKEENQAVSVTEDHQNHKVVMDVKDFLSGDVKVKVVDENELVVEGSVEQQQGGSVSKKSFCRGFTFPGLVRSEGVTSTMSSDGILTVTVPKKTISHKAETKEVNEMAKKITVHQGTGKASPSSQSSTSVHTASNTEHSTKNGHEVSKILNTEEKSSSSAKLSESKVTESTHHNKVLTHNQTNSGKKNSDTDSWHQNSCLPLSRRGLFSQDSFFQDARQDFDAAVQEVLAKFRKEKSSLDDLTVYRSLRESNMTEENQAMKVSENERNHQVVIDVRDFMSGDVKVKAVGKDEVVVKALAEKQAGGSKSTKTFSRCLNFPGEVDMDAISAAMSSDGVLTITVPKVTKDATVGSSAQEKGTMQHSEANKKSSSHHEESSFENKEERDGFSSHSFSKMSRSRQQYVL